MTQIGPWSMGSPTLPVGTLTIWQEEGEGRGAVGGGTDNKFQGNLN